MGGVAISNHRLVAFEHDKVTFRYKDYAHGNKKRRSCIRYCVTDHRKRRIGTDGNRQRTDRPNAGRV
jgi:Putative transposase